MFISSHINTAESYIIQFPGNILPSTINYLKKEKQRQSKSEDQKAESS